MSEIFSTFCWNIFVDTAELTGIKNRKESKMSTNYNFEIQEVESFLGFDNDPILDEIISTK